MIVWIYALCQCAHSLLSFEHQPFCITIISSNYVYIINCIDRLVMVIINVSCLCHDCIVQYSFPPIYV